MEITLIAAIDKDYKIGNKNIIPWDIPLDRRIFRKLTLNHPVIMGRKTFESIGHPLEKRRNIILTRNRNLKMIDCEVVYSIEEALTKVKDEKKVFVIGGEEIFNLFLPFAKKIYLSCVDLSIEGDKFFPKINFFEWIEICKRKFVSNGIRFEFILYEKKVN